jgi:hypothetical protein
LIEAIEDLQELATSEAGNMLMVVSTGGDAHEGQAAGSDATALEAVIGNLDPLHSHTVIEVEFDSSTSVSSQSTSSSSSIDLDNIPLGHLYQTKIHKKPSQNILFEPMIPNVNERIGNMSEMRNKVCERLPFNHPLQPPMIQPLNMVSADMNVESSSSQPTTNQTVDTSVLDNLVSHYSGELPEVRPNLQKASEVASMEVILESPPHQAPNLHMASTTSPEHISSPEHIVPEQTLSPTIHETVSEPDFMITSDDPDVEIDQSSSTVIVKFVSDKPSTSNQTPNSINSQPSSSQLAIQPVDHTKPTKVPSPPTIFLDSTLLTDVCEKIFQDLNKLIQAGNDLVHKDSYEK